LTAQRLAEHRERRRERQLAADADIARLRGVGERLAETLGELTGGESDTPAGRCGVELGVSIAQTVRTHIDAVEAALGADLDRIADDLRREGQHCERVIERLLSAHDLPGAEQRLDLSVGADGRYDARLRTAALGLEAQLELEIPADHLFAQPLRVDRVTAELEVQAPDRRGWLSKKVKLVPHKLGKKLVVELSRSPEQTTIKLRASADPGDAGFDLVFSGDEPEVRLVAVPRDGDGEPLEPFEPAPADAARLLALRDDLSAAADTLAQSRKALASARLDDTPLAAHEHPERLVERLIERMAPVVQEIARHSPVPTELALKRRIDDDHREEIFVRTSELAAKLTRLPEALRGVFDALGLDLTPPAEDDRPVLAETPEQEQEQPSVVIEPQDADAPTGGDEDARDGVTATAASSDDREVEIEVELSAASDDLDDGPVPAAPTRVPTEVSEGVIPIDESWLEEESGPARRPDSHGG
jgi:hypothetical protein